MTFKYHNGRTLWVGDKVVLMPISLIDPDPRIGKKYRPKASDEDQQTLIRAIKQSVLWSPIAVQEKAGRFVIQDGHHRLLAYKILGRETIPAVIVHRWTKARVGLTYEECLAVKKERLRHKEQIRLAVQNARPYEGEI